MTNIIITLRGIRPIVERLDIPGVEIAADISTASSVLSVIRGPLAEFAAAVRELGGTLHVSTTQQATTAEPAATDAEDQKAKRTRLTPEQRAEIANSTGPASAIADRYGVSPAAVYTIRRQAVGGTDTSDDEAPVQHLHAAE